MASLEPRGPYSEDELEKLYPKELQLHLVQIVGLYRVFLVDDFPVSRLALS